MLSVLTVDEVENRYGEVPSVASAAVNYAAGNATIRFDENLLEAADIKILVHQRGQQSADESKTKDNSGIKAEHKHGVELTPEAESFVPKATLPASTAPAVEGQEAKLVPSAPPTPQSLHRVVERPD